MSHRSIAVVLATALALLSITERTRADVITDWNQIAIQSTKDAALTPNAATRVLAIVHAAAYDATTAIEQKYEPYHEAHEAPEGAIAEVAAAAAAHYALTVLFPPQKTALNAKLGAVLAKFPKGDARDDSKALGVAAAVDILNLRAAGVDGSFVTLPPYTGSTDLGKWRPTLPSNAAGQDPQWATVTPFVLPAPDTFRSAVPPDPVTSSAYATAFEEVRTLGAKTGSTRTETQSQIAQFWVFHTHLAYNGIARQVSNARGVSLFDNARLFALLNIALADSRIAAWDAKYTYSYWRPVTAVTGVGAGTDEGNAATTEDAAWLPFIDTPAHPEYPSGHSTTGAAGATVLAWFFGEETGFTVASESLADTTRAFASFWSSAVENGRSRIYGGIHYQFSNAAGLTLGKSVGEYAVENLFAELPPSEPDAGLDASVVDGGEAIDAGDDADAALGDADAGSDSAVAALDASLETDGSVPAEDSSVAESGEDAAVYVADASTDEDDEASSDDCSITHVGAKGANGRGRVAFWGALVLGLAVLRARRRK